MKFKYERRKELDRLFIHFQSALTDYSAILHAAKVITAHLAMLLANTTLKSVHAVLLTLDNMLELDCTEEEFRDLSLSLLKKIDASHHHAKADKVDQLNEAYVAMYSLLKKLDTFFDKQFVDVVEHKDITFKAQYKDVVYQMVRFHIAELKDTLKAARVNSSTPQAFFHWGSSKTESSLITAEASLTRDKEESAAELPPSTH